MKKVFILFLLVPNLVSGQIIDDFESGTLVNWVLPADNHWNAESTSALSGNYSLHHSYDNSQAGVDQAGLSLEDIKPLSGPVTWSFKLRHGYNPSASNNWGIFLMSDAGPAEMMPGGIVNGFAFGVNLSGYDDTLRLWKIRSGSVTRIINTGINWERDIGTNTIASVTVVRSATGEWKITVVNGSDQSENVAQGSDTELFYPRWFGVYYKYTMACDRLLWVDDIHIDGNFSSDTIPPLPQTFLIAGENKIKVSFDEEPDFSRMTVEDFVINPGGFVASRFIVQPDFSVEISFSREFENKIENEIVIKNLCDSDHNCKSETRMNFTPVWAECGDVIISEIMADPVPSVGLPEREYIEILNTTAYSFNLKGWKIVSGNYSYSFPESVIGTDGIIILSSVTDTTVFRSYGNVIGLNSFPALNDGGKMLVIYNEFGDLIHGVEYSPDWYCNILKSEGGWSLEMVDAGYPFYYEGNWTASVSRKGGTPGLVNSTSGSNHDNICPVILNVFPDDSLAISVRFSEPVKIDDGILPGIKINGTNICSFEVTDPLLRRYRLSSGIELNEGTGYELSLPDGLTDLSGNQFCEGRYLFGMPEPLYEGDIRFNELLFNPSPETADYVEFFNCSDKVIDASDLLLVSVSDVSSDTSAYLPVCGESRCIMPSSYYVVTTKRDGLLEGYSTSDPKVIYEAENLVSMADDEGHLLLLNRELDIIDEVMYDEKMHFALLSDYEGVSLEKVRQCIPSSLSEYWHSAAESSGWGTPGVQNSDYTSDQLKDERINFSSTKITPDNDGFEDLLAIDLSFSNAENIINVTVFDDSGLFIRELAGNLSVGTYHSIIWDGTDSNGSLVGSGIYIISFSGFDEKGKTIRWKKVCTVLRR